MMVVAPPDLKTLIEEQKRALVTPEEVEKGYLPMEEAGAMLRLGAGGFLGIDVGIRRRTSWALIDRAGEVVSLGDVPVDPEMGNDRYAQLAVDLYRELPWDSAEVVGVEWPWTGPNKYIAQAIAMATGVVAAVAALFGKELMFIDPSQAKKALTGDHLASAKIMQKEAQARWPGIEVSNADRGSAIGIALAVWERRR